MINGLINDFFASFVWINIEKNAYNRATRPS